MATPSLPPSDGSEPAFESMLELDLPKPELPQWAALAIAAIAAIMPIPPEVAFEALRALIEPLKGRPEGPGKDAVRVAMRSKEAEIVKARTAAAAATTAAVPATARQSIPVVRDDAAPAAVEMRTPVVRPGGWTPLMADGSRYRLPSSVERSRRVQADAWGARIEHAVDQPLLIGDVVRLTRANGTRSSLHVVTALVAVTTSGVTSTTSVAVVRAATDADTAPRPVLTSTVADSTPATAVESSLAAVASEAATLNTASTSEIVQPTERGTGTNTDSGASIGIFAQPRAQRAFQVGTPREGSRATVAERTRLLTERALIAGSVSANGWLQVSWTGEGSTLHGKINDALIALGREGTDMPPVPTGENYAGEAVAEMRSRDYDCKRLPKRDCPEGVDARWIVGRALQAGGVARAGDAYGTTLLIVDLLADGTLRFDGSVEMANTVRTKYATKVARVTLNSKQLTPWLGQTLRRRHGAVKRGHCWYVPPGQAKAVRALIGGSVYADAVEAWAAADGEGPLPKFDEGSIGMLWGDHELMSVNTGADLLSSLSNGLRVEVSKLADQFNEETIKASERARDNATKKAAAIHGATEAFIASEADAAGKRATVSSVVAARILRDLGTAAARLSGYATVLGETSTADVVAMIAGLQSRLEALTDDTSIRGAMLELV